MGEKTSEKRNLRVMKCKLKTETRNAWTACTYLISELFLSAPRFNNCCPPDSLWISHFGVHPAIKSFHIWLSGLHFHIRRLHHVFRCYLSRCTRQTGSLIHLAARYANSDQSDNVRAITLHLKGVGAAGRQSYLVDDFELGHWCFKRKKMRWLTQIIIQDVVTRNSV